MIFTLALAHLRVQYTWHQRPPVRALNQPERVSTFQAGCCVA
jgi:hypothetical protein